MTIEDSSLDPVQEEEEPEGDDSLDVPEIQDQENTDDELDRYVEEVLEEFEQDAENEADASNDNLILSAMRTSESMTFGALSTSTEATTYANIPYDANATRK